MDQRSEICRSPAGRGGRQGRTPAISAPQLTASWTLPTSLLAATIETAASPSASCAL